MAIVETTFNSSYRIRTTPFVTTTYQDLHDIASYAGNDVLGYSNIGQSFIGTTDDHNWLGYRLFAYFDTSEIPDNATINSAKIQIYWRLKSSAKDFNIVIQNGQPIYPHNPWENGDIAISHYSSNGI